MPRYDFKAHRLFVSEPLTSGHSFELDRGQSNYILNVLRFKNGGQLLCFNGRDGEWLCDVEAIGRKSATVTVREMARPQPPAPLLTLCFTPIKLSRLDYMVQKAVEMGVGSLQPVLTRYTQPQSLKHDKMLSWAREAAEQCGVLTLPEICDVQPLDALLEGWNPETPLIFCDEGEESQNPLVALEKANVTRDVNTTGIGVLIGPEGGFSEDERTKLRTLPFVTAIPLGPRVLRADTAAVAALAIIQSTLGDWK